MSKVFICDNEREYDQDGHGVLVVETIGEVVVAGRSAEEPQQRHAPRHG